LSKLEQSLGYWVLTLNEPRLVSRMKLIDSCT
jgi:hypothetical protein